jgi:hypothetical protein
MVEFIYVEVTNTIKFKITSAHFLAISCNEMTLVGNGSWLNVHACICENWSRVP